MFSRFSVIRRLCRVPPCSLPPQPRLSYSSSSHTRRTSTVDPDEVAKFAAQAAKWWQPDGPAAPLHRLNPVRLSYIRAAIEKHLILPSGITAHPSCKPLMGVNVLDVGCGGKFLLPYSLHSLTPII